MAIFLSKLYLLTEINNLYVIWLSDTDIISQSPKEKASCIWVLLYLWLTVFPQRLDWFLRVLKALGFLEAHSFITACVTLLISCYNRLITLS